MLIEAWKTKGRLPKHNLLSYTIVPATLEAPSFSRWYIEEVASKNPQLANTWEKRRNDATLAISEIVTNSVTHKPPHIDSQVLLAIAQLLPDDETILLYAGDSNLGRPFIKNAKPNDTHFRGLPVVDEFSTDWGLLRNPALPGGINTMKLVPHNNIVYATFANK